MIEPILEMTNLLLPSLKQRKMGEFPNVLVDNDRILIENLFVFHKLMLMP